MWPVIALGRARGLAWKRWMRPMPGTSKRKNASGPPPTNLHGRGTRRIGAGGEQGVLRRDPPSAVTAAAVATGALQGRSSRDLRDRVRALDSLATPLDCDDVAEDGYVAALRKGGGGRGTTGRARKHVNRS